MTNSGFNFSFLTPNVKFSNNDDRVIHNKNSRKNKIKLSKAEYEEIKVVWTLSEYKGRREYDGIDWRYQSSSDKLGNGILGSQILQKINSSNVFEDFTPKENDYLSIRLEYIHPAKNNKSRPYIGEYISFIYTDSWNLNKGYDHIDNCYEIIMEGEIVIDK
jgi:hypothetical protein